MKEHLATIKKAVKELELVDTDTLKKEIDRLYKINKRQEKQIQFWMKESQRLRDKIIKEKSQ
jgi:hypothetical protein